MSKFGSRDALDNYCGGKYGWFHVIKNTKKDIKATETWGTECLLITDKDIEALKENKLIYHDNGEYTTIVRYKGED